MSLSAHFTYRIGALNLTLDLDVAPGEVVALLGPNGAGKSTALRCLTGLSPVDAGSIAIDGEPMDEQESRTFVEPDRRSVGMVFQDYLLFDHMTVLENVAFGLRARGTARHVARPAARAVLDRVGLTAHEDRRPSELSGGQRQRVALARALATSPRLLLLDEPLAALDASTRVEVRRELRRHLDQFDGMCVIVTHDPVDAHALSDRVVIIDEGRVVQQGTLTDVAQQPRSRFVADLVGVNLISGEVIGNVLRTAVGTDIVVVDAVAGASYAVIKPHSVLLSNEPLSGASVRNSFPSTVAGIDRLGDRIRVSLDGPLPLVAEVTVSALESLRLHSGSTVFASVKATDIEVYPA